MSSYPILEQYSSFEPPFMRAVVGGDVGPIVVYVIHPLPASIRTIAGFPISMSTDKRDAALATIRGRIDQDLGGGMPVLVMGDLNTTEREPAYAQFSAGFVDAHAVSRGLGHTWRPEWLEFLPFGLLRIDYVFVSSPLEATETRIDCSTGSDHCALEVWLAVSSD